MSGLRNIDVSVLGRSGSASELIESVEQLVLDGRLRPGDRMPPVRAVARELTLAPNTVASAYRRLQERGLIYGDGRRGTFVSDRAPTMDLEPPAGVPVLPAHVVDLASGTPDPQLLPDLAAAVTAAHRAAAIPPIGYGHAPVNSGLAAAFGSRTAQSGTEHRPAIVGGALDGIERVLATRLRAGDLVAVEDPTYPAVLALLTAMNLRLRPVPIDDFGFRPDDLTAALAGGVAAVVITPRAQNPTGAALDEKRAAQLAMVLAKHTNVLIVEDDYAGAVGGGGPWSTIPEGAERWAVIRSVAKSLGPDLRLAAVTGDRTTIGRLTDRQLLGTGWVSHILQRTVANLLSDPAVAAGLQLAEATYRRRREHLVASLAELGIAAGGRSGLNVWVPVRDEAEVVAAMQADGYAIRAGGRFRLQSPPAVRITTAAADLQTLSGAASSLAAVVGRRTVTRTA